jgi:hypothetical protein
VAEAGVVGDIAAGIVLIVFELVVAPSMLGFTNEPTRCSAI